MAQEAEGYGGYQGYGGYGAPMDPASMRARLAMAMLQQGSDSSPIRSPWQGAARMSQALFGALMMRQMQDSQASSWQKALGAMPTGGGLTGGGAPGGFSGGAGTPGLPAQPSALADLANDPDIMRGVANAARNGLPDSATIGQSLAAGSGPPPQMGPPMPTMAPNNAAGGMPPGYIGGGGGHGSMPPNMTASLPASMQHNMQVAGPGVPPLPPSGPASGNGPQGAGAGFNPADLAMFQQDMQAVPGTASGGGGGTGGPLLGRLTSMGYSPQAAAGILGNFQQESGLNPSSIGDQGTSGGLGQWHGSRFANLQNFAQAQGGNWKDPNVQLAFADKEIKSDPQLYQSLNSAQTPQQAALIFQNGFERPAPATANTAGREAYAAQALGVGANSPALAAIQGAAGPPGGGPAPNMFAQDMQGVPGGPSGPQGQIPASMQHNMQVAGPGIPSGARGGAPPPMPPQPPPGAGGGGNPLSALGNMFGMANPSSPQGGSSPSPAGGGAGGQANDPRFKALTEVLMDPYAAPGAKQMAAQFLQYYMPHPTTWEAMPGTNNLAEKNWLGQFTGNTRPGPHQTSVVDAGTDFMGVKHQGVFDKDAPLGQQLTVIDPSTGRPVSPGQGGGVPPPSPTGSSVTPAAPGAKVWSPGQPLDPSVDSKLQGLAVQYAGNDPRAQGMVYQYAKALLQGNQQFVATGTVAKAPYIEAAETIARQVDPDGMPQTRFDTIKSNADMSTPTSLGGQRMAAQTSVKHLGALAEASDLLAQQGQISSSEMGAKLQDWGMRNLGGASSKFVTASQAYQAGLLPVLREVDKLQSGGNITQEVALEMKANLSQDASPPARRAALTMLSGLMQDKVGTLQDQWHLGVGNNFPDLPIIDKKGQAGLDYIKNWGANAGGPTPAGGAQAAPAPQGFMHQGTAGGPIIIKSDDDYNRLPSGAKFIGPDGKTRAKP